MSSEVDPYHLWLGIPPREQPPHHYRLLGIGLFEDSADVISMAAQRQMAHVKQLAAGPHVELSQQVLNALAAARVCLLDPRRKSHYDAELQRRIGGSPAPPPVASAPPSAADPNGSPLRSPSPDDQAGSSHGRRFLIGSGDKCDIVISEDTVSDQHCNLLPSQSGYVLEDLRSTNGTYVNGQRVTATTLLDVTDRVTLGRSVRLDWLRIVRNIRAIHVGTAPDNDVVLKRPSISGYHAVLLISGREITVRDKRSTNGLAVGALESKVQSARVQPESKLYFGSHRITVSDLLAACRPALH